MTSTTYLKRYIALCFSIVACSLPSSTYSKKIFCDLGEVCMRPSRSKGLQVMGFSTILKYMFSCGAKPSKERFLDYLIELYGKDASSSLPTCYRDWMIGKRHSDDLVDEIRTYIEGDESLKSAERQFFSIAANNMRPEAMAFIMEPSKKAIKTLKACLQCLDENGNPNELYIISNWDADSFEIVKKRYPELFSLFDEDHIITSGAVGLMKPDNSIFEYVIKRFNLTDSLSECIFIDDMGENVASAHACGFNVILHTKWRHSRKELEQYGVFASHKKLHMPVQSSQNNTFVNEDQTSSYDRTEENNTNTSNTSITSTSDNSNTSIDDEIDDFDAFMACADESMANDTANYTWLDRIIVFLKSIFGF